MKYYIAVFVVVFCMLSCNRHSVHWETLRQVEACIEAQPDSALAALKRIDAQELAGKDERAKYALLLSMALDLPFDYECLGGDMISGCNNSIVYEKK